MIKFAIALAGILLCALPARAEEPTPVVLEVFDIYLPNPGHWVKVSTHPDAAACAAAMKGESARYVRPENSPLGADRYWRCR